MFCSMTWVTDSSTTLAEDTDTHGTRHLHGVPVEVTFPSGGVLGAPVTVEVKKDKFYVLGEAGKLRLPNFLMPPLMNNHGNYIVSMGNVCRWMAEQAEAMGVEIFPGMACSELVYGENGEVKGVVAGEFGKNPDGTPGDGYEPGMELHGKYVFLSEGVRDELSRPRHDLHQTARTSGGTHKPLKETFLAGDAEQKERV